MHSLMLLLATWALLQSQDSEVEITGKLRDYDAVEGTLTLITENGMSTYMLSPKTRIAEGSAVDMRKAMPIAQGSLVAVKLLKDKNTVRFVRVVDK